MNIGRRVEGGGLAVALRLDEAAQDEKRCGNAGCKRKASSWLGRFWRSAGYHFNGLWYCSPRCLTLEIADALQRLIPRFKRPKLNLSRPKIGLILIDSGLITGEQLELALNEQRRNERFKLGDWLQRLGFVRERDITIALSNQYGLSWINLEHAQIDKLALNILPPYIALSQQMLALDYDPIKNELAVALSDPAVFVMLKGIKKMLRCEVVAYVADKSKVESLIKQIYSKRSVEDQTQEVQIEFGRDLLALSRFIVERAIASAPDDILIEPCVERLWIRFWKGPYYTDYFVPVSPQALDDGHQVNR